MDTTLLIPHYQTLDAIRLCLRSIRLYTQPLPRVLVLDNGSRDASREYLGALAWVECVDTGVPNDLVSAQAAALNLGVARVATPLFAVLHSDLLHGVLAFALGLYLGWITELAGSALPAMACHVINNSLFTMLTALWGTLEGFSLNAGLVAVCGLVFTACVVWLRQSDPRRSPVPR